VEQQYASASAGNVARVDDALVTLELDHDACRSLWVAVIQKAIKDMAYATAKRGQSSLTPSEREKLNRIYELDPPEHFFESSWFEEICRYLGLSSSCIRDAVLRRLARGDVSIIVRTH
jgi:hypothetical protein